MGYRTYICIWLICIGGFGLAIAQSPDSTQKSTPQKAFSLFPIPVVYYTPETRFAFGAALSATFRFRRDHRQVLADTGQTTLTDPDRPRPSNVQFIGAYTQNQQILLYSPFQIFYDQNRYYIYGEAGYYRYTYNFYGLGLRETPAETYGVDFPRIRLNAFRRVRPNLYAGLRYEYEKYTITSVEPDGLLATGTVPGGLGSRISGLGLGLLYDTRNTIFYPDRGIFANISYLGHGRAVGSEFSYNRYVADVSLYYSLTRRAILAVNSVVSLTGGTAPFNALSLLGSGKRLRGYYEGRYRDENMALLQTELRLNVWKRLGAVVFGGVGILGDSNEFLRPGAPKVAAGAGLRGRINADGLNVRVDYGVGNRSTGLYVTIGEAF
ncbi:outer membrane protein assembly factor BamA [Spirosoma lacussanchae]|uniref:BamA/TamA family outer membrane protein n=1 Tax=Spirosoma lacussanchae TaxID=1884249 RepID=UPI001107D55B|nr:BamA/TamA family outer membrane protein [Spirosoma lacussanchae]